MDAPLSPCLLKFILLPPPPAIFTRRELPGALFVETTTAVDRRRPAFAVVALSLRHGYQYFNLRAPPGHKPWLCTWPLQLRRPARRLRLRYSYARVTPSLCLHRQHERLAITFEFSLGSGPSSLRWQTAAKLRPDRPHSVAKAPPGHKPGLLFVASSTAPSACGLRYRSTRTTDSFRFPPSTWPAGQSERLAITLGFRLGLRVGRPPPPAHRRLPPAAP